MKTFYYFNEETLTYEKVKPKVNWFLVILVLIAFLLGNVVSTDMNCSNKKTDLAHVKPFDEDALIEAIEGCNLKYPYIVLAQAKLESANFTSKVFKQNNNMFGMRKARVRITAARGELNTYAYYRDWVDCVYDYAMYQSSVMCNVSNENEYFAKLGARYAEDTAYVPKLKKIIKDENLKAIFED